MAAIDHFKANIERARSICALAQRLDGLTTSAVDVSDLYRSAIVLGVSALDHFVHEFVRTGMLDVHAGVRAITPAHLTFRIPLSEIRNGLSNPSDVSWFDRAIRDAHSWLTFQDPERIADAVRLISAVELWNAVAGELGLPAKDVRTKLKVIVDRRNKIAHEADLDPTNPGQRWPIDQVLVNETLNFLESVSLAIDKVAV